jgi:photosystem II stability/assembly factor-like uncharacterized protein
LSLAANTDGTLFLGTPDGHIFFSGDGGRHWELRGRVTARLDAVVQRLLADTRSPGRLFAAVWFQDPSAGGAVFRSDDAGRSWSLAGLRGEAVRAIEQSFSDPQILLAGTRTGIFRSPDAGQSWERISPPGHADLRNIDSLAFDPRDPRTIYAGTYHLPWKTFDAGKTWVPIAAGMIDDSDIMALRIDARDPTRLFASACSGIYHTENAGKQWIKLEGIPYVARRTQDIVQDSADPRILYAGTTEGLWITRDSGETWARATPRDWVVNAIAVLPSAAGKPSRIILGIEDGGIQASDDAGAHFAPSNAGFRHRLVLAFAASSVESGHWLARFSSSSEPLLETHDAGQTWQSLPVPPALSSAAQFFFTPDGWFAAPAEGGLLRFDESARQWSTVRFIALGLRPSSSGKTSPTSRTGLRSVAPPVVLDLRVAGTSLFLRSSRGFWSGNLSDHVVQPASVRAGLSEAAGFDASSESSRDRSGSLWLVAPSGIFEANTIGQSRRSVPLPADSGEPRWIRSVASSSAQGLLLGTVHGVYWQAERAAAWQHLAAGLPAVEMLPVEIAGRFWLAAGKSGGLYLSGDAGSTWTRLDGPGESSFFLATVPDGSGFAAASRTEGLLRWTPNP